MSVITIDCNIDLIYSTDEGTWYFQRYGKGEQDISQAFSTESKARMAYRNNNIKWRE